MRRTCVLKACWLPITMYIGHFAHLISQQHFPKKRHCSVRNGFNFDGYRQGCGRASCWVFFLENLSTHEPNFECKRLKFPHTKRTPCKRALNKCGTFLYEIDSVCAVYSIPIYSVHLFTLSYAFIYEFNEWKKAAAAATNKLTQVYRNF